LSVSAFRSGSEWLTAKADPSEALDAARRLLNSAIPSEVESEERDVAANIRLESAGVDYSSGTPNLLFTSVLPIAATELGGDGWGELVDWVKSSENARPQAGADPVRAAISAYWRDQLVKTTAAFDFLPKYFPASQVRSVYASVWGESQVDSNFQRWLTTARDVNGEALCAEVTDAAVRDEAQAAFAKRLSQTGTAVGVATATSVARAWDPKFVGTSGKIGAMSGLAVIPAAVVAGAIVGSLVSWQSSRATGRPPSRYRRVVPERTSLRTWYPVRPDDATSAPTFVIQP